MDNKLDFSFQREVIQESKEDTRRCYSCGTCAAGCIFAPDMDYTPTQIMKAINLGYKDLCLNSKTIWICASCQTCTTRCPQDIDIAKVIDTLRIISLREGIKPKIAEVPNFHKTFLQNIRLFGRLYELGLIMMLKLKTRDFLKDVNLGMKMFKKGKIKLLPSISNILEINRMFSRINKKERLAK